MTRRTVRTYPAFTSTWSMVCVAVTRNRGVSHVFTRWLSTRSLERTAGPSSRPSLGPCSPKSPQVRCLSFKNNMNHSSTVRVRTAGPLNGLQNLRFTILWFQFDNLSNIRWILIEFLMYGLTCFSDHLSTKTTFCVSLENGFSLKHVLKEPVYKDHFLCFPWAGAIDRFNCI